MIDLDDIIRTYPRKNSIWLLLDSMFVADVSDFGGKEIKDPWNREFPGAPLIEWNDEREVVYWTHYTTVAGNPVMCRIFND